MKKIKSLAVIVLMIITIMILSTKAEATTGKINSETVRVRKEATTKSSILIQLDKDKEVEILEESEGWYKISVTVNGEKITGYINSELVDVKGETTEKPVEEPQDNNQTNNNETPVDNNQLQTPNETQNENNEQTSNVTTSIEENKEYTLGKSISVRILPLMNSREIGTINDGNVKTLEIVNDWCKIENDEMTGWVRINNLKKSTKSADIVEPTTPQPVPDEQTNTEETIPTNNDKVIKTGYVSTDSLKVRKEANTSSEIIDSLKKMTKYQF